MDDEDFDRLVNALIERRDGSGSAFERHAQTVLTGLITILLAGTGALLMGMNSSQSELVTDVKVLQTQVVNLTEQLKTQTSRYVTRPELLPYDLRLQQLERYHNPAEGQ